MNSFEYIIKLKLDYIRAYSVKAGLVKYEDEYVFFYHQRETKWNFLTPYEERI